MGWQTKDPSAELALVYTGDKYYYANEWKTLNIIKIAFHGNLYPLFHHFTTLWLVYLHAEIQRVN